MDEDLKLEFEATIVRKGCHRDCILVLNGMKALLTGGSELLYISIMPGFTISSSWQ